MKTLASLLISLLLTFSSFAGDPPDLCKSFNDVNQMLPAFYHGQATGDYECFNKIVMQLLAVQTLQANSTTTIIDIAQNSDFTTKQKLDKLCNIFNGISSDFSQTTRGSGIRLDADLQGTGIIFCEVLSELQSGNEYVIITQDLTDSNWSIGSSETFKYRKSGDKLEVVFALGNVSITNLAPFIVFDIPLGLKSKNQHFGLAETIYKGNRELIRVFVGKNDTRLFLQRLAIGSPTINTDWDISTGTIIQGSLSFEVL